MNKVFKVIWSKTKNCYVVASELAKSHTKAPSAKGISRVLVCGVLACVLSCGAVMPVIAAGNANNINADNDATITGADVWEYLQGNGIGLAGGNNASAFDIVIGKDATTNSTASAASIVIGKNAQGLTGNTNLAIGTNAVSDNYAAIAIGTNAVSKGRSSVALGDGIDISGGSSVVAVGTSIRASGNNAVALGHNTYVKNGGIAIGDGAVVQGMSNIAFGRNSVASGSTAVVSVGHKAGDTYYGVSEMSNTDSFVSNYTEYQYEEDFFRKIINVGDGTSANEAATVGQTIELVAGDNVTVVPDDTATNSIGQKRYKISAIGGGASYSAGDNISIENNIVSATGLVKYDNEDKDVASLEGVRGTKLTNLKAANLTQASTDAVIGNQLWSVKQDIIGFASDINRNKANITTLNQSVTDALSSVSAVSDLVDAIDSLKADASLNNLSNQGKAVIATAAADAVQAYMAEHGGSTGNTNESARPRLMALTAPVLTVDPEQGVTQEDLDAKADISYVDNALANKADISDVEALSSTVSNLETNLTGSINTLDSRVSDTESALSTVVDTLDTKADKDAVYTKEETDTKLADKADKTDLDLKADKSELDAKADKDASNIDVDAWAEKLGTGEIAEGNTGLVNGGTVYNTIKELGNNNMVQSDGQTISIGKDDTADSVSIAKADGTGRTLRGVLVDPEDDTSAANVGYVNAIADNFAQGINQGFARMDDKINKTGAGAAALANLHPIDTDGDTKLNIAAGIGRYHGETAGALGLFYKPSDRVMMNISSTVGNNDTMFGAGVSIAVDKPVAGGMSKAQLVKAVNSQAEQIEQQNAKIQQQDAKIQQQDAVNQALLQRIIKLEQSLAEKK